MDQPETELTKLPDLYTLGTTGRPCLIVVSGNDLAHRYWLDRREMIIGRAFDAHIKLSETNVSRHHARVFIAEGSLMVEDLDSTNGTYINSERLTEPRVLSEGDLIGIGHVILKFAFHSAIDTAFYEEVVASAQLDALTGLVNRKFFDKRLDIELTRSNRYRHCVSLLLCDLDNFKQINDLYGHQAGDVVLRVASKRIQSSLRQGVDTPGRYGGEELIVLLPETDHAQALAVAEKIRALIADHPIAYQDQRLNVTASIGVSTNSAELTTPDALVRRADENLYRAKKAGKNCVQGDI